MCKETDILEVLENINKIETLECKQLHTGNQYLEETCGMPVTLANNFANANWRPLYRELLPYAQTNWNKIGVRIANKLFLKVPYDKMFPV